MQRIANNGIRSVSGYDDETLFPKLSENFEKYISALLPLHTDINEWEVHRIDYNLDLHLASQTDVEQYILLMQKGDKNHSWNIRKTSKKQQKPHPDGSVLFENKQYRINFYNKYLERLKEQAERGITDTAELEASKGILRIEVQAKKNKLNSIKGNIKRGFDFEGKPIEIFARYEIAAPLILRALKDITGEADYTTLERAEKRLCSEISRKPTREHLIAFIRLVSRSTSLWRAKEVYEGDISINTLLRHLNRLNINPVTIPVRFGRDTMDNLLNMAAVQLAEQRAVYERSA